MSSAYIIATIVVVLIGLSCYAFLSQSLEKKRQQRLRMVSALKARTNTFKHLLHGFPENFLTKDLQILITRFLVEATEQLAQLEPKDKTLLEELQVYSHKLEEIKTSPAQGQRQPLESAQQVKEVKHLLQELNVFIAQMNKRGNISNSQASHFEKQIKKLVLQMTADAYLMNAKQCQQAKKLRLSLHYYTLALKLLLKENQDQEFQAEIKNLKETISQLEQEAAEEDAIQMPTSKRSTASIEDADKEWEELQSQDDDPWKKKNIYD